MVFINHLKKGETDEAQNALMEFLFESKLLISQNLLRCKNSLDKINMVCQTSIMETSVHPTHILIQHDSIQFKINALKSKDNITNLVNELCQEYCSLVNEYSFCEYSKTIRSVVNYIHLYYAEELTNYIQQTRIKKAIQLFETTRLSVSEVSLSVGYSDFAYFSRLFHKQTGCSPKEYCKKLQK